MSGTPQGGARTKKIVTERNPNYYAEIGSKGGKKSKTGGFWYKKHVLGDTDSIARAGAKGGSISRRRVRKDDA
jgi:general stress protein YciG